MTIDDLADLLKGRGCRSVHYFHTDHFEPWSITIDEKGVRAVEHMARLARSSRRARRLSLFYSVFVPYRLAADGIAEGDVRVPDDEIVFIRRSDQQERLARQAIAPLVCEDGHELHLHVHHEYWTRNHSHFDTPVARWVNAHSTSEADGRRLDLHFQLCREAIERETGRRFNRWGFIHGNWALNASDPLICHVTNEIQMIKAHGGYGDFSFPAGRSYCDPKLKTPFTCLPLDLPRAYDDPQSDPKPIGLGTQSFGSDRFFIWNAQVRSVDVSLDYYSAASRDSFKSPERIVRSWLAQSATVGDEIFIKTHAHSMNAAYRLGEPDSVIPHLYPDIARVFDCLERVCERAGIELRFETANEIVDRLAVLDGGQSLGEVAARNDVFIGVVGSSQTDHIDPPDQGEAVGAIAARVSAELMQMHQTWLQSEVGSKQPDELYKAKLSQEAALERYELAIAAEIAARYPVGATRIIEIGTGWGGLSILLAHLGFEVMGFEGNLARHTGCQWHFAEQNRRHPALLDRLSFPRQALFPEGFREDDLASDKINVCIATNITSSYSAAHEEEMIAAAMSCDELILDLARFGKVRDSRAEREALFENMTLTAFRAVEPLFADEPYEYWRMRSQALPGRRRLSGSRMNERKTLSPSLPFSGRRGLISSLADGVRLAQCPVCHSPEITPLWTIPMTLLKEPLQVFGGYFNQIPTLQTPATAYRFDLCRACESIFLNPAPAGQKDGYRSADHYIRKMREASEWRDYEAVFESFAQWIPEQATVMVDAACGIGQYLEVARRRHPRRWQRLLGLELSEKYVAAMNKNGLEAYAFDIDSDELGAVVAPGSVDFIVFAEAFEHVERPLDAVQKLAEALRIGGRLYFTAQRYGPDVTAAIRPGEPIYIGETVIEMLPARTGCRIVQRRVSDARFHIVLEK